MPRPLSPPPPFGIITRRISPGRYVPSSSDRDNVGIIVERCSRTSAIVRRSGPGAPSFAATWSNASSRPSTTASIVTCTALLFLIFAFGLASFEEGDFSVLLGWSAVAKGSPSCSAPSSTVTAFPPPFARVRTAFRRPSGTTRSSDFCRVIVLRPCVLRSTARAEPGRSPRVNSNDLNSISAPLHPRLRWILGFVARGRLTHRGCLTALHFRSKRRSTYDFYRTSPRGSAATARPESVPVVVHTVHSVQRPCLLGVESPPSGPRVWTFTSCRLRMPSTPRAENPLASRQIAPEIADNQRR